MLHDRTWLLYGRKIANEATTEELLELDEILKANPDLHFTLQMLGQSTQKSEELNIFQINKAYNAHLEKLNASNFESPLDESFEEQPSGETFPQKSVKRPYIIGSILAAAAIIIFFLVPTDPKTTSLPEPKSEVSTKNGSRTYIVLPDGTKVWLNSKSKVTYDKEFGEKSREIVLTGEAYFDVARDPRKPFIIHTAAMDIRVLGTEFNVKSYPNDPTTETSLIKGSIEVTLNERKAEKIILKPNEKLVVTKEEAATQVRENAKEEKPIISLSHLNYFSQDSTIMETSWVRNELVFEDESFADLAATMERWYGVTFRFENNNKEKLRFTGKFREETIDEALRAMKITADFNYSINNNIVTITE
ncbi:MAG: FecR domain-containing protein [Chitinophagaceae bacterium]|nr:FecR domain-containing protein [Chitinophagaceae bacterium]